MKAVVFNLRLFILVVIITSALAGAGLYLTHMDTDIIRYLPRNDPVLSDAGYIFYNHPIQDQIVIDIHLPDPDPDTLTACAVWAEEKMNAGGLFKSVGMDEMREVFLDIISHVLHNLPVLFTQTELHEKIAPHLEPEWIQNRLETMYNGLFQLDSVGQSEMISQDPLGFKDLILARLSALAPGEGIRLHKGHVISSDERHLLLMAVPVMPGTNTEFAARLSAFLTDLGRDAAIAYPGAVLTPVGAYRSALDNERIARGDVRKSILLASLGIAILLVLTFSRPLIGLFAFVPALAGTAAAFFVFSLCHRSVSVMAVGFGGAIISIAVDHGIAYLLFLDQPHETRGKDAAAEIRAVGFLSTLTTVAAFGILCFTDFPIFQQLGMFTALGLAFSFLFVHTVFPHIFVSMPRSSRQAWPLGNVIARVFDNKITALIILVFAVFMAGAARPGFNVNLNAMNTVTGETREAEKILTQAWGDRIFGKIYLVTQVHDLASLQKKADQILEMAEQDRDSHLASGFLPSMIFPGESRRQQNVTAWKTFWNPDRTARLKTVLGNASTELGFAPDAFDPFYALLSPDYHPPEWTGIPEKYFRLLGITRSSGTSGWVQFSEMTPGPGHDPQVFRQTYSPLARIFDPQYFSHHLGQVLFSAFTRMLVIIALTVAGLLFLFFLDLKITAAAMIPVCFAMISTLGTLNLLGRPIDIPGIMLSIIIFGMGIDYSLFILMSYRRYGDESHPGFERVRTAVFMAGMSTLIGFGSLCFAEHSLLQSAGFISFLGIGYSLIGAYAILPPLMRYLLRNRDSQVPAAGNLHQRILRRYRNLDAYPKIFARCKLRWDVMFEELPGMAAHFPPMKTILDIGCGYGVPGCWFLEWFPESRIWGMDPDPRRVCVAALAMGKQADLKTGAAPDLAEMPGSADAALLLDIIHFLSDKDLEMTLTRVYRLLMPEGRLIVRAVVMPENGKYSWMWRLDELRMNLTDQSFFHRPVDKIHQAILQAGFTITHSKPSGGNQELAWFIGVKI
jgi:predicted exporter/SAM-dependent methyltransferase